MIKRILKLALLSTSILLLASNAWALKVQAGDTVTMNYGNIYNMSGSNTAYGSYSYDTFCVEKNEYFNPGRSYIVDSIEDFAVAGGYGGAIFEENEWRDYLSQETKWLYQSYFEGLFAGYGASYVQNAIWYSEDEINSSSEYNNLITFAGNDFATTWDIKVVNIVDACGNLKQSQLVGEAAPVPEPATMLLFGSGIAGLAGFSRKRFHKA